MTNVAINDDIINKARSMTSLKSDQAIVEKALEGFIFDMENAHEIMNAAGKLRWDPEFAGVNQNDRRTPW